MATSRQRSIGRYELLIELGRGGMAELFLGRLHGAGGFAKLVAIKRILPHLAQDQQFTEMFLNEGRIAAQLAHPNVCQVFELAEVEGELVLAMEYLDGVSWEHLIAAAPRGGPAMRLAAGVLAQAADGLHYAHTLRDAEGRPTPVVHRDVSPQNLFVTVDGACKVLDFGVSKMTTDGPRTRSGVLKGKLPYMSPEQIRGEPLDARADVFSLGVCLWEALAGARLFDRETDFQIWKAITEHEVPPVAASWPECPPMLAAAVHRALDRDPDRRQASARELADDLRRGDIASPAEIAEALHVLCRDRIADRAREVASAISERRTPGERTDPDASDAPLEQAGETLELQPAALPPDPADTAGMQLRRASIAIKRPARPGSNDRSPPDRAPRRGHLGTAIVAAVVAAAVTAVVVMIALGQRDDARAPAGSATGSAVQPTRAERPARGLDPDARAPLAGPLDRGPAPAARASTAGAPAPRASTAGAPDRGAATAKRKPPHPQPPATGSAAPPDHPAAPAEPGYFSVDSRPYATIYADGKYLGETPLRAKLPAGDHAIRAVLEDRRERSFSIHVIAGEDVSSGKLTW